MGDSITFDNCFGSGYKNFNYRFTKMKKIDYVDLVLKVVIILGMVLVIYWFVQLMFGGTPTISQFSMGLILALVGLVAHLHYKSGKFSQFIEGTFPRFEGNIESSFVRIKEDMRELKGDMSLIKRKLKV